MADNMTIHNYDHKTLFSAVFQQSAVGIAFLSQDGSLIHMNERFCELTGMIEENLRGKKLGDFLHLEGTSGNIIEKMLQDPGETYANKVRVVSGAATYETMNCIITAQDEGESNPQLYTCFLYPIPEKWYGEDGFKYKGNDDGKRMKRMASSLDISKLAINPNATTEELIRKAITIIPGAFQFPESTLVSITHNDEIYQSPGYDGTGASIKSDIVDDGSVVGTLSVSLLSPPSGGTKSFVEEEQMLIDSISHQIGNKIIQQRINTNHDTGSNSKSLKKVQNELIHEKLRLQEVLDIAGTVIILINKNQSIEMINRSGCEILGYSSAELIGKNWYDTCIPEDIRADRKQVFESFIKQSTSDDKTHEVPVLTKGGERRVMIWRYTVVMKDDGVVAGILSSGLDITDRKKAEEGLAEYTRRLEETNSELESFSYSVSHDLRAPLRAIDGYSRMVLEDYVDRLDGDGRRQLNVICREAKKMGELIDDLLRFSRMGKQEIQSVEVNMQELFEEVYSSLKVIAPRNDIEMRIKPLPNANGDRTMVQEVVMNLLSNAIKFSSKTDHPVIICSGERTDKESIFHVEDNGVGFDMKYANKLFGVFQRLHSVNEFEGTGVGLALVQRIVLKHGGRVWGEGKPDNGATFSFSLPH